MKAPSIADLRPAAGIEKIALPDGDTSPRAEPAIAAIALLVSLTIAVLLIRRMRKRNRQAKRDDDFEQRWSRLSAIEEPAAPDWLKLDALLRDLVSHRFQTVPASMSASEIVEAMTNLPQRETLRAILTNAEEIRYAEGFDSKAMTVSWLDSLSSVRPFIICEG